MKVLFIYTQAELKLSKNYSAITSALENSGNKVISIDLNTFSKKAEEAKKQFQKVITNIKKSDFIVIENTNQVSAIGFLVSTAINEKKPILSLSDEKSTKSSEAFLNYAMNTKLLVNNSYNLKNLNEIIETFLNNVKKIIDTKFILIISPEIDTYLQWASDNKRMHKAQVVRRAVEEVMNSDKEFKKYITTNKK